MPTGEAPGIIGVDGQDGGGGGEAVVLVEWTHFALPVLSPSSILSPNVCIAVEIKIEIEIISLEGNLHLYDQ